VQIQALREIPVMRYPNMRTIPRKPAAKPSPTPPAKSE